MEAISNYLETHPLKGQVTFSSPQNLYETIIKLTRKTVIYFSTERKNMLGHMLPSSKP